MATEQCDMLEAMPVMAFTALPDGTIDFVNRRWCDYTGLGRDTQDPWQAAVDPCGLPHLLQAWQTIQTAGEGGEIQARLRRFDGQYRTFQLRLNPIHHATGEIARWYGVATDIEDQRQAEDALKRRALDLQLIVDTISVPLAVTTPTGEVESLNQPTLDYFGLSLEELKDWKAIDVVHPDDLERTIAAQLQAHQMATAYNVESRHRRADGVYRWHNVLGMPLRDTQGEILCWLHLLIDIEERKCAEEALAASERDLRLILDSIPVRVGIYDTEGNRLAANRQARELSGMPGRIDWRELYHPDDRAAAERQWRHCLEREELFECEYRARMADGSYRWHLARRVPMRDENGKVVRWYGVSHDIEELKRAQCALQESERNLQLTIDSIPGMVTVIHQNGEIESLNKQSRAYLGLTPDDFANRNTNGIVHPDHVEQHRAVFRRSRETGEPFEFETRMRRFDGVYRWVQVRGEPARDAEGNVVLWYHLTIDIDERKRAEEALAASERKLQITVDTIPALAWSARPDGTAEFLSKHYLDYIGMTAEEACDWGWSAAVHSEDMAGLTAVWQSALASGMAAEAEARLRRFDGKYRWFLFRVNPQRDDGDAIVKWYGVNTDIEDRKHSDEVFRTIVETTPDCVKLIDRDGTVLRVNSAGAEMAGVSLASQVVGLNFFDFVAPEHRERYRAFHNRVCDGEKGELEFDLMNALGIRRHMETHAAPLRNADGTVVQLGVTRDMTERKRSEDRLRRSEAFLAEGQYLARMGNLSWNSVTRDITWSEPLYHIFEFEPGTPVDFARIASRIHPEDLPLLPDFTEQAWQGRKDFECQFRIILPDGSIKHLHLIAHRAGNRQDDAEYIGAILDITQRRIAEEALEKLRSEFTQISRFVSLGTLTAAIAHEVNQPLAGILTNASTCLRMLGADPPNIEGAQETARRTIRDGKRAADVIARLRALFTNRTATIEPVDLNDAVREVIALSATELQRNRIMLRTELAGEALIVTGDRIQLQQVIMNLLRNAVDAMTAINSRQRMLFIKTAEDAEEQARLSVCDAGTGIDPEVREKLFETFTTTKSDGMGIGLSISRSIIERHNGHLWFEANDGPGSTFSFAIPRAESLVADARNTAEYS